jgi:predicted CopG family antitoxin
MSTRTIKINNDKVFYDICFKGVSKEILFDKESYKLYFFDENDDENILDIYEEIFDILNKDKPFSDLYKELIEKNKTVYIWLNSGEQEDKYILELINQGNINNAKKIFILQIDTTLKMLIHLHKCKIDIIKNNIKKKDDNSENTNSLKEYLRNIEEKLNKCIELISKFKNIEEQLEGGSIVINVNKSKKRKNKKQKTKKKPFFIFSGNSKKSLLTKKTRLKPRLKTSKINSSRKNV